MWINPKYRYLGCSPDGLVGKDGLLEIKSLKLFKNYEIEKIIKDGGSLVPKETFERHCFQIQDRECKLKKTHSYYYQVQFQMLVTERSYCDFLLYAEKGPVSIERIERDEALMAEILEHVGTFSFQVLAPEFFVMRVPRDLLPFILPEDRIIIITIII